MSFYFLQRNLVHKNTINKSSHILILKWKKAKKEESNNSYSNFSQNKRMLEIKTKTIIWINYRQFNKEIELTLILNLRLHKIVV